MEGVLAPSALDKRGVRALHGAGVAGCEVDVEEAEHSCGEREGDAEEHNHEHVVLLIVGVEWRL